MATTLLCIDRHTKSHSKRKIESDGDAMLHCKVNNQTVNLIACANAFINLHWWAKTSFKNSTRLLRDLEGVKNATKKDSSNIFE